MAAIPVQVDQHVEREEVVAGSLQAALRVVAATTAVGLVLGLVVGGVGSRLAMRALFLTTGPVVRGMPSDDGFAIGRFDPAATLSLLVVGTVLGVLGAFVYLAVRPSLMGPRWLRLTGCAVAGGAVVGSMIVHPGGVDFTVLRPVWFAVLLFTALPALFAVLAALAVERAIRPGGWFAVAPLPLALAPLAVLVVPPLLVLVGLPVVAVLALRQLAERRPGLAAVLRHPASTWGLRAAWAAIAAVGAVALGRDLVAVL